MPATKSEDAVKIDVQGQFVSQELEQAPTTMGEEESPLPPSPPLPPPIIKNLFGEIDRPGDLCVPCCMQPAAAAALCTQRARALAVHRTTLPIVKVVVPKSIHPSIHPSIRSPRPWLTRLHFSGCDRGGIDSWQQDEKRCRPCCLLADLMDRSQPTEKMSNSIQNLFFPCTFDFVWFCQAFFCLFFPGYPISLHRRIFWGQSVWGRPVLVFPIYSTPTAELCPSFDRFNSVGRGGTWTRTIFFGRSLSSAFTNWATVVRRFCRYIA